MQTRIKICGITRPEDALAAARLGVDAVGLVFAADSPRRIDIRKAREILDSLPPFIQVVGLFMDQDTEEIRSVLDAVPLDLLQFHGLEEPRHCRQFGRRYIKAVGVANLADPAVVIDQYPDAAAILLDSHVHGSAGGTGEAANWQRLPDVTALPVILAGGLNPDNVAEAIRIVQPFAVDVSSGVESAPGHKDPALMEAFINEVRRVSETIE